jgi:hypothetical protein
MFLVFWGMAVRSLVGGMSVRTWPCAAEYM